MPVVACPDGFQEAQIGHDRASGILPNAYPSIVYQKSMPGFSFYARSGICRP